MNAHAYSDDWPDDDWSDDLQARMDDAHIDAFNAKLAERVRFKGQIEPTDRPWSQRKTLAFLFLANLAAWWVVIAIVSAVARSRGF